MFTAREDTLMPGLSDREAVKAAALRAVMLLLFLGEESYSDGTLIQDTRLVHSPLAGQQVKCEDVTTALVGPGQGEGIYHVITTMRCGSYWVQAYCSVAFHMEPLLIETDIRVGERHVSCRNVSARNGMLTPWGTTSGYDLMPARQAASYATSPQSTENSDTTPS